MDVPQPSQVNPTTPPPPIQESPTVEPSSSHPKLNTKLLGLFALLILIAAVPLSVFVSQQEQDPRQQAANPKLPQYKVFVTSASSSANLGGIAGADTKCQQLATAATLPGRWIAWLSDATTNAKDRIVDAEYLRIDGRRVAKNKADLLDSRIKKELSLDEKLVKVESTVWTGTKANGEKSSNTCNSWTEETNAVKALIGVTSERNDGDWTEENPNHSCAPEFKMRFYCFQQPAGTTSTPTPTNNPSLTPSPGLSPTPTITPTPTPPTFGLFVTSESYSGNLGGLTGADAKCNTAATSQSLGGQWTAWLSDSTHDAKDRILEGKYTLLDGTIVANSKADLIDGTILHGINMDEKRQGGQTVRPWTATNEFGVKIPNTCTDWTSADSTLTATKGNGAHVAKEWTTNGISGCHQPQRLYCFQTFALATNPTPSGTDNGSSTTLDFTIALDGIGAPLGNIAPRTPTRTLKVEVRDAAGQLVGTFNGNVVYQTTPGAAFQRFKGTVNVGTLPAARYNIRIKTDKYLAKVIPNQTLGTGTLVMPGVKLIAGDVNDDNKIDIADLHLVERACPGKLTTDPRCSQADINDDGKIEIVTDANIIFSNMAVRLGE